MMVGELIHDHNVTSGAEMDVLWITADACCHLVVFFL